MPPTDHAVARLARAIAARRSAPEAALALAALDLRLQYEPIAAIDRARFRLWAHRARLDASRGDAAGLWSDVATLEWIRDRLARGLPPLTLTRLDTRLEALRAQVGDGDLTAAAATAAALRRLAAA